MERRIRVGFDVGGTFTDGVLVKGKQVLAKVKSLTTEDVTSGIVDALDSLLTRSRISAADISMVSLGTTHTTNAIIERRNLNRAATIVRDILGDEVPITLSHRIATISLLERENSTVLNASVITVMQRTVSSLRKAVKEPGKVYGEEIASHHSHRMWRSQFTRGLRCRWRIWSAGNRC